MKEDIQLELEFIEWLQKFNVIDRKFARERIIANHNKHIKLNNLLLGEKTISLGMFSAALGCAITIAVNVFKTEINSFF